jgi:hypothetical protein
MRFIDLTGTQYTRLTVLRRGTTKNKGVRWVCLCACGAETEVDGRHLRGGKTTSCGCLRNEGNQTRFVTHGKAHTTEYRIWRNMHSRCENPNVAAYKNYGGRGITVCKRWFKFERFYADMGPRPSPELTVERRDNDAGYTPANCYWATRKQQAANKRNTKR